jgi:hypothetical protein
MLISSRLKQVLIELKAHSPFTMFGAFTGIMLMLLFRNISHQASYRLFYIFHPAHVVLSAMVTASLFRLHEKTKSFLIVLIIGYVGSIGTATLSDSILPFFGEDILGVAVPTEAAVHSRGHAPTPAQPLRGAGPAAGAGHEAGSEQKHERKLHIGFIEEWYIVNPAALLGIVIAYFLPRTKLPHAFHILISTWASTAHIMMNLAPAAGVGMNTNQPMTAVLALGIFVVLFIAVLLPCCFSDIVFPMLFVKAEGEQCVFCGGGPSPSEGRGGHHDHRR